MYLLAVAALISSSNAFHGRMATKFVRSAQLSMSTATVVPTETILSTVRAYYFIDGLMKLIYLQHLF